MFLSAVKEALTLSRHLQPKPGRPGRTLPRTSLTKSEAGGAAGTSSKPGEMI